MLRTCASRSFLLALLALGLLAAPAAAAPVVSGEFDVPGLGSNNKMVQGPDGNMWVTTGGGGGKEVAKITPDGVVTEYTIDANTPSGITVGPGGLIWVARNGGVVSFNPVNPEGTKKVTDIGELGTTPSIVLGPDGNLWAVGEGKDKVVRISPSNPGSPTAFPVAGLETPKDIDVAGSLIVIAASKHIFAVNTAGAVVGDQKVGGQAQGVGGNPNGQYAFTQPVNTPKEVGLLAPGAAPIVRSAEGTDPFGITLGADGAYWSPEFISDGLSRITADGTVIGGITGFKKGSAPRQIAAGPGNTLWVTLEMTKKVGRVSGLEPPPPPPPPPTGKPKAKIDKGPKGAVKTSKEKAAVAFRFSSTDAGAAFQCRLFGLPPKGATKKGGKKAGSRAAKIRIPAFKTCKSPKRYRLKPGRYRFQVRALNAHGTGAPAKRTFHVVRVAG